MPRIIVTIDMVHIVYLLNRIAVYQAIELDTVF
jgi:hypothetical protein